MTERLRFINHYYYPVSGANRAAAWREALSPWPRTHICEDTVRKWGLQRKQQTHCCSMGRTSGANPKVCGCVESPGGCSETGEDVEHSLWCNRQHSILILCIAGSIPPVDFPSPWDPHAAHMLTVLQLWGKYGQRNQEKLQLTCSGGIQEISWTFPSDMLFKHFAAVRALLFRFILCWLYLFIYLLVVVLVWFWCLSHCRASEWEGEGAAAFTLILASQPFWCLFSQPDELNSSRSHTLPLSCTYCQLPSNLIPARISILSACIWLYCLVLPNKERACSLVQLQQKQFCTNPRLCILFF